VVNDSFIKVFNSMSSYDTDKPFKAWLRTIVVNTAIDKRRKELKLQLNVDLNGAEHLSGQITVIDSLNAEDILNLMRDLPPIQLAIFNLYEIDGYNHDEIGEMLSIPSSSSRVYLSRAKEKLRKIIKAETQNHG
jgi:RNA polymerase sigma factor (sigma-70 family)